MSVSTILAYVLIALGLIVGIWGGVSFSVDLMNSEFMSFLVSGVVLLTIGAALLDKAPDWLTVGLLWATTILLIIYLYGLQMPLWVFLSGVVVLVGIAWGLMVLILK